MHNPTITISQQCYHNSGGELYFHIGGLMYAVSTQDIIIFLEIRVNKNVSFVIVTLVLLWHA